MKRIKLRLGERSYNIHIASGAAEELPRLVKAMGFTGPVVVVTDKNVRLKTKKAVTSIFKKLPNDLSYVVVSGGEKSKSLEIFQDTIHKISKKTKTHRPMIVALGGGVVGDLAGFVAATYRRGVPLVQIPTTLLAQVDSSIGGKVGVDLIEAKNLIGAFKQPKAVLIDPDFLKTLPKRQIKNGLAEVIKYAIIKDHNLFNFLEENMKDILSLKKPALEKIIFVCAQIKARIVEKDELDTKNVRIALNFGHTLGHAIEAASGYSNLYNHGESIAIGMVLAGEIALELEMITKNEHERIRNLIKKAGLPIRVRTLAVKDIMNSYEYDKKFTSGFNRFVLPRKIGAVEVVDDIPVLLIKTVLREMIKGK